MSQLGIRRKYVGNASLGRFIPQPRKLKAQLSLCTLKDKWRGRTAPFIPNLGNI